MPTLTVTASPSDEGSGGGSVRFVITDPTPIPFTVLYAVGGTAQPGVDYLALPGSFVTLPNQIILSELLVPIDDALLEGNETVIVYLLPSASYTIGAQSTAVSNIIDNEFIRYRYKKLNGEKLLETSSLTINEAQARIITLEIDNDGLNRQVIDLEARVTALGG
jgi:hypothetical protein